MNDEQKFHQDDDSDCLLSVAVTLREIAEKIEKDNSLAMVLWPTTKSWFEIEAERLLEIKQRWIDSAR